MNIKESAEWIACAAAGLGVLVIVMIMMPFFPADAAVNIQGYGSPVLAFEFATTPADLAAVFGAVDDPERARRMAMMDKGNRWDFLFMTIYTAFAALFGLSVRRHMPVVGLVIVMAAIIAGLADMVETRALLSITADLRGGITEPAALATLSIPVFIKFTLLGVSTLLAGYFIITRPGLIWKAAGASVVLAASMTLLALISVASYGFVLSMAIGVSWIAMLAYALTRSVRPPIPPR